MTLASYIHRLRNRAEEAKDMDARAPVHKILDRIADELMDVSGMPERDLTTSEAADILGYSHQYVSELCRAGKFPNAKRLNGGPWRIPRGDIVAYKSADESCNGGASNLPSVPSLLE